MTIHNLYIFDRSGRCLFYSEWHRRRGPGIPQEELFVELVVKNPLCPPRAPIQSLLFRQRLDAFVRSLPYFGPRNPNN